MYKKLSLMLAIVLCLSLVLVGCDASRPEDAAPEARAVFLLCGRICELGLHVVPF